MKLIDQYRGLRRENYILFFGRIPAYYLAMFVFTLGEVFCTLSQGPYMTRRVPSSHRGRISGVMNVLHSVLMGTFNIVTGRIYDSAGSTAAWTVVIAVLGASVLISVFLIRGDRKAYPKLYE